MMTLTSLEQALGKELLAELPALQAQWQDIAACESHRTGVGLNRRSYFLDSCHFENTAELTICGQIPDGADYYFLENTLVQISFTFEAPTPELASCVVTESENQGYLSVQKLGSDGQIPATEQRMLLARGEKVGVIVEPAKLAVLKPDVAPDVHFLQAIYATSVK